MNHFVCKPGGTDGLSDGWFRVSWRPNWTGAEADCARSIRRRLRGRWIAIRRRDGCGGPIFRRLSFSNDAAPLAHSSSRAIAVRLSWDDLIALSDGSNMADCSLEQVTELLLEVPTCFDWLHIVMRIPRVNAEATILALASLIISLSAILFSIDWHTSRSRAAAQPPAPPSSSVQTNEGAQATVTVR